MSLTNKQKQIFDYASKTAISQCITDLEQNWRSGTWLQPNNLYKRNSERKIQNDFKNSRNPAHCHLAEYIAGSVITHCFDGWMLLGKALRAEISGSPDIARHLGYYAELRAAMSLLASEGVGVFNWKHAIVDQNRNCRVFGGNSAQTHNFAWNALQYWGEQEKGRQTLFSIIRPGGIALGEWLYQFSAGANFIATSWLNQWGLDLQRFVDDRDARNLSSYRPTSFTTSGPIPATESVCNVMDIWRMCEPSEGSNFPALDRHLLRQALEVTFKSRHLNQRSHSQDPNKYKKETL